MVGGLPMKVDLLRLNGLDVAMLAASTCVSSKIPDECDPSGLLKALRSGHDSLLEHITLSFSVEKISRVCLAQLTRHRHVSFSVQSQRYVPLPERDAEWVVPGIEVDFDGDITDRFIKPTSYDRSIVLTMLNSRLRLLRKSGCVDMVCKVPCRGGRTGLWEATDYGREHYENIRREAS